MTKFVKGEEISGFHPEGGISALRLHRQIGSIDAVKVRIIAFVNELNKTAAR